jgi:alpha/beta superfamily hydrolase
MAMLAADSLDAASVIAVSIPWIERYDFSKFASIQTRKLIVCGSKDFLWNRNLCNRVFDSMRDPKMIRLLEGDHFFRKMEHDVARIVTSFILEDNQGSLIS